MNKLIEKYAGEMITENCEKIYDEIAEHEDVSKVQDNGDSGKYYGYKWYTVVDQDGEDVFEFYMKWN